MANEYADRKAARQALAAGLKGALTLAQEVYAYEPYDFGQRSPIVTVNSMGSARPRLTYRGTRAEFDFDLMVWAVYSDEGSTHYESDSEDLLDDLEKQIGLFIAANQETAYWNTLTYRDKSQAGYIDRGGKTYRTELIPLTMGVHRQ